MASRQCIFCLNQANTREHVWPKWILAVVDQNRPYRFGLGNAPEIIISGEFKIRCVCGTCNNGWMSRMEDEVKLCLEPMLRGTMTPLTQSVQTRLSHWAVKIAMVVEAARPKSAADRFYSDEDTRALREKGIIPDMTRVEVDASQIQAFMYLRVISRLLMDRIAEDAVMSPQFLSVMSSCR
jgi:hypothetical protein